MAGRRRGALVREDIWFEDGKVTKYSLVYINPGMCSTDNGRVLGYDNNHGYHHRHFMGEVKSYRFSTYEKLLDRFMKEVHELWRKEDEQDG